MVAHRLFGGVDRTRLTGRLARLPAKFGASVLWNVVGHVRGTLERSLARDATLRAMSVCAQSCGG
jgi:hypothetical protein